MKRVFGPVPSRRLGRSLGVDLVPFKTCSYDCIYCQLDHTTCKTIEQMEWVCLDDVLQELQGRLSSCPDYITLGGSGEPTLFSRIEELITNIKTMTDIPVAVLTNGSLLWQAQVRRQVLKADLIIPSLDAGSYEIFQKVNRPHSSITFENMLNGLIQLRREYQGKYWLEVFLVKGYTDSKAEVDRLAKCVSLIKPDRVQLNTVTRPPADKFAINVSQARMQVLAKLFDPPAEVIADFHNIHQQEEFVGNRKEILNMLQRRPCTINDISNGLCLHKNEIVKYLEDLKMKGDIKESYTGDELFYSAERFS